MQMDKDVLLIAPPVPSITKMSELQEEYWNNYYTILFSKVCSTFTQRQFSAINNLNLLRIGILAIADALKREGANVRYLGPGVDNDETEFMSELRSMLVNTKRKFVFIGVSAQTTTFPVALKIAKLCKETHPETPIILGGPHAASRHHEVIQNYDNFDVCVTGVGEQPAIELFRYFLNPSNLSIGDIKGIAYRNFSEVMITDKYKPDSSYTPTPMYSLIDKSLPMARVYNSIGCPYRCSFCAEEIWHRKLFRGKRQTLMKNIEALYNSNGTRFFFLGDEDFAVSHESLQNAIDVFSEFDDVEWGGQTRVDTFLRLDDQMVQRMAESGFRELHIGFESGNENILALNKKNIKLKDAIRCCKKARQRPEILIGGYFLVGLPGDTRETIADTIEFSNKLIEEDLLDLVEFNSWVPSPGSEAVEKQEFFGLVLSQSSNYESLRGENHVMHSLGGLDADLIENSLEEAMTSINRQYADQIRRKNLSQLTGIIDLGLMGLF